MTSQHCVMYIVLREPLRFKAHGIGNIGGIRAVVVSEHTMVLVLLKYRLKEYQKAFFVGELGSHQAFTKGGSYGA